MNPINRASIEIFERYLGILESQARPQHLIAMCETAIQRPEWPVDKMSRWLGFVQGIMFEHGLITVLEERDLTRPLFHQAYKELGIEIPNSVTID